MGQYDVHNATNDTILLQPVKDSTYRSHSVKSKGCGKWFNKTNSSDKNVNTSIVQCFLFLQSRLDSFRTCFT